MNTSEFPLVTDETRRAAQHDAIKADVVDDVNADIAVRAVGAPRAGEAARLDHAANEIRANAMDEVIDSERSAQRSRGVARASQIIDYVFFLAYALLAARFLLALFGARPGAGFARFISAISSPLYAPFDNIVDSPAVGSGHLLMPAVLAVLAYLVLHIAINRLLRVLVVRKTAI